MYTDFMKHDFGDEYFDLVLMNPPFKPQVVMYEKAKMLSDNVAIIAGCTKQINKFHKELKIVNSLKSGEFCKNISMPIITAIYTKGYNEGVDIRSKFNEPGFYSGRNTFGDKAMSQSNVAKGLVDFNLNGYLVAFSHSSERFGKYYKYIDFDCTLVDLKNEGHGRFTGIECAKDEADELYTLACNEKTNGGITYTTGWSSAFTMLAASC